MGASTIETRNLNWHKHQRRKFQVIGAFFGLWGLGLIAISSINYLLTFIGIGLIAYGIYLFVDDMNLGKSPSRRTLHKR